MKKCLVSFNCFKKKSENYSAESTSSTSSDSVLNVNKNGSDSLQQTSVHHVYDFSQDLLDKQIKVLEKKYGEEKVRNAAVTIQRAFRHYILVKKFATITSIAKAENKLSGSPITSQEEVDDPRFLGCSAGRFLNFKGIKILPLRPLSLRYKHGLSSPIPSSRRRYSENELVSYSSPNIKHDDSTYEYYVESKLSPDSMKKQKYRIGLYFFNKKPEHGISYLIKNGFLEKSPQHIAQFFLTKTEGLSMQMIGEYLGDLQDPFNRAVLEFFAEEFDLSGVQVDVALRKFQTYFRMPGEPLKVHRIIEVFSKRYFQCNPDMVAKLRNSDTVHVLAFAILMLNTDLHKPNFRRYKRMAVGDFIENIRDGVVDGCRDIDEVMLIDIYRRVKENELKSAEDHVNKVLEVQSRIFGKIPNLALPHRRFVLYCQLYEVRGIYKKEKGGVHQRDVFLFNDLLVITKLRNKKKSPPTYTFRQSFSLLGLAVYIFKDSYHTFGIRLSQKVDNQVLVTFNAKSKRDRVWFVESIRESIRDLDEMENLRTKADHEKLKINWDGRVNTSKSLVKNISEKEKEKVAERKQKKDSSQEGSKMSEQKGSAHTQLEEESKYYEQIGPSTSSAPEVFVRVKMRSSFTVLQPPLIVITPTPPEHPDLLVQNLTKDAENQMISDDED